MATKNIKAKIAHPAPRTHEGAVAARTSTEEVLRRTVMARLLWEDSFYEQGTTIADRIETLVPALKAEIVAAIAIEAREVMKLRHVPLLLVRCMAKLETHKHVVAVTLARIIQRADELTEFLALYQGDRTGTKKLNKLSSQVKRGLALAFQKFTEYDLWKYTKANAGEIKLRDILFLCHAKPKDEEQAEVWKRLIANELVAPNTWEHRFAFNEVNRKETWESLLSEKGLPALALLRNLRNMKEAGVDDALVVAAIENMRVDRVLPFRFIAAARYAPQWEPQLERAMLKCLGEFEKLPGRTALVVDGSGSMFQATISAKSELLRFDAAAALAILIREICEDATVTVFSYNPFTVPARRGFALRDAMEAKAQRGGTNTQGGIDAANNGGYDRIIVISDEQSHEAVGNPLAGTKGYFVNVASYQNGIGYGSWLHIDGFSEGILSYIRESEK